MASPPPTPASRIAGVGAYLPDRIVTNAEIEARLAAAGRPLRPGTIEAASGVRERRYARDDEWASDLAAEAARHALAAARIDASEVDVCLFTAATQDVLEPATVNRVLDLVGATRAHGMDLKNACSSFVNGLDVADALIATGRARVVVVASGEIGSRYVDWDGVGGFSPRDDLASFTLGDGAGAAVVVPADGTAGIHAAGFTSLGRHWELATVMYGGTAFPRDLSRSYFRSHSGDLVALASEVLPPLIDRVLGQVGWRRDDVDVIVPHQAGRSMVARVASAVGVGLDRFAFTLERYGNIVSASFPVTLADSVASGRVVPGTRVVLVSAAAGFSAGVVALTWG